MDTVIEDLSAEHGLLNRCMLIYDKCIELLQNDIYVSHKIPHLTALIIRTFIEDHHEKTEETHIFPIVLPHNPALIKTLIEQHKTGRTMTSHILNYTDNSSIFSKNKQSVCQHMMEFNRLYRRHAAYEDTVIFKQFKKLLSSTEYVKLSEILEKEEETMAHSYSELLKVCSRLEHILSINM